MTQHSVLIVGGCGFIGRHIAQHFTQDPRFSHTSVLSRTASDKANKIEGVSYVGGDLSDPKSMQCALEKLHPTVIIHAASPSPTTGTPREYQRIAVDGTKLLLELAKSSSDVRVLIYTSSSTMARGREHVNLEESAPLADEDASAPAYARTKAIAEKLILRANSPLLGASGTQNWAGHLCTAAIRLPIVYGTHDTMTLPGCFGALEKGHTGFQLGDGRNLWDFCSTENAAGAHVLLARSLLAASNEDLQVNGEAFNIHDGQSRPFWDFARSVWRLAGYYNPDERIRSIPVRFVLALAVVLEFVFWACTFGTKRPQTLGTQQVEYACYTHTYSIEKARKKLGYEPKQQFEEDLAKAVAWSLKRDGWGRRLKGAGVLNA